MNNTFINDFSNYWEHIDHNMFPFCLQKNSAALEIL